MTSKAPMNDPTLDELSRALADLVHTASPAIGKLAQWVLEHPHEIAFHSVRALAKKAEVNANTVFRLSVALGYSGFEPCREAFQAALRHEDSIYRSRARRMRSGGADRLATQIRDSARDNLEELFSPQTLTRIDTAAAMMLAARRIYCIGVRSCFSLAHYLAYTGHMAFGNFAPPLAEPGAIADAVTGCGPEDVVIVMSFSRYSSEVLRAYETASARGARIITITDSYAAPITQHAEIVFKMPMDGPQILPSQGAAFALTEALVGEMILASATASGRIEDYERRLLEHGVYL